MEAYFDNSATTCCSKETAEVMMQTFLSGYGNPSSLHKKGVEAEAFLKKAKEQVAKTLKAGEKEIIFTSGGTESDNLAILGTAYANRRQGMHLITTAIEHPAVLSAMGHLEEQGFRVTYLKVDGDGLISLDELRDSVTEETILVSIMYVNNEIGALEPIEEAARIVHERNGRTLFHSDAVQAYGKYRICPKKTGIDLLSVSAHKIHGPKGAGFLYVKDKTKLKPLFYGGGQQRGMRSGTENVGGIAGLGQAAQEAYTDFEGKSGYLSGLRECFLQEIAAMPWAHINGRTDHLSAPHIVNVSFDRVRSEVLLHALEERGIYVSAGSACSSNKPAPSRTLLGIGVGEQRIGSALRFSFSTYNTQEEIACCAEALRELVPALQRFTRH